MENVCRILVHSHLERNEFYSYQALKALHCCYPPEKGACFSRDPASCYDEKAV
jgi:hypothetical protein